MTSPNYIAVRQKRESNAEAHYLETHRKYAAMGKNADDIGTWWEWREQAGGRYAHHEYPKPYCGEYFGHFIRSIMRSRFVDLKLWLRKEFVGDEVDRDYLEGLLAYAEQTHGLDQDRTMLVLRNGDEESYGPLPLGQTAVHPAGVDSSNVILGGEDFRRRAATIRGWCQSKMDSEATGKDQNLLLHRRQLEALAHEQEMIEKYAVGDEDGYNTISWNGEKEIIGADGKPHLLFYQEHPKPHSSLYLGYFLNHIYQLDVEDITPWLNREFNNDAVDKKYLNSLLSKLEALGMNIEGTTVVQEGDELVTYPPNPIDAPFSYAENTSRIISSGLFYGGKKFIRRAQAIRDWCRLEVEGFDGGTLDVAGSAAAENFSAHLTLKAGDATSYAGKPTGNQDNACLDAMFSYGFTTAHCDHLAKSLDLCPPDQPFEWVDNANTKIWILADAIKFSDLTALAAKKLARLLGSRYGYGVAEKLTKKGENIEYNSSIKLVQDSIKRMKEQGKFK